MGHIVKILGLIVLVEVVSCTIAGETYMDALNLAPSKPLLRGEDPCKPLYWYPRQIPDYCYTPKPEHAPVPPPPPLPPVPLPVPVPPPSPMPLPMPVPMPMPLPMPMFMPLPAPPSPLPGPIPMPMSVPAFSAPPLPMGMLGYPPHLMPVPGQPYPIPAVQNGLVPGIEGLVSHHGAINILPFSDAYSDLLENHKQRMIRIRLQNLLDEYEYPRKSKRKRCYRKYCWN